MATENRSLIRGVKILECLGDAGVAISAAEVARRTGLHRATVHRLLTALSQLGYVHKNIEANTYTTGFYLHTFGHTPNIIASIVRHARRFLERLAEETGETVCLGALEGIQMVYCDRIVSANAVGFAPEVGMRLDAHATAIGKALLAIRPEPELRLYYAHHRLAIHTPHTVKSTAQLLRMLATTRRRGYAIEAEEYVVGRRAVAAPIINPYGRATCALSVEGPAARLADAALPELGVRVAALAKEIADHVVSFDRPRKPRAAAAARRLTT